MELFATPITLSVYSFRIEEKGLFEFSLCDSSGSILDEGKAMHHLTLGNNLEKGMYQINIKTASENKVYQWIKN